MRALLRPPVSGPGLGFSLALALCFVQVSGPAFAEPAPTEKSAKKKPADAKAAADKPADSKAAATETRAAGDPEKQHGDENGAARSIDVRAPKAVDKIDLGHHASHT